MDWVDRPKNYKGLYGILQLLQGSHLDNFSLKTLKLGWVAFHPRTFQLKCLDFHLINIRNSPQCSHVSAMGYKVCVSNSRCLLEMSRPVGSFTKQ